MTHFWKVFAVVALVLAAACVYAVSQAPLIATLKHNQEIIEYLKMGECGDTEVSLKGKDFTLHGGLARINGNFLVLVQSLSGDDGFYITTIPLDSISFARTKLPPQFSSRRRE